MKRKWLYILFSLIFICITAFSLMSAGCISILNYTMESPEYFNINSVNHKGYFMAPENTLAAYRMSVAKGFNMVECDVRFTRDGVPVLLHDSSVDRTSDGEGYINELTYEEVSELDFGSWKSVEYVGEQIPTFEEFLLLCRDLSIKPYVEIKAADGEEQIKTLVYLAVRYGMIDKVTWISFNIDYLRAVSEYYNSARLGYIVTSVTQENCLEISQISQYGNAFFDCKYSNLDSAAIELCIENNIPVEVWTINKEKNIINLDPYVSGVSSDMLHAGRILYDRIMNG